MILRGFIERQVMGLRAFLDDPDRNLLFYRSEPDVEAMAIKLLAGWSGLKGNEELGFALNGTFVEPRAFYEEAEAGLMEVVGQLFAGFKDAGKPLVLPDGAAWDRPYPALGPEELFAELLEGVARGFSPYVPRCLFVVRFEAVQDVEGAAQSLLRLSAAVVSPSVKLVVLDERRHPLFPRIVAEHDRYKQVKIRSADDDHAEFLTAFFQNGRQRVLGISCPAASEERLLKSLGRGAHYGPGLKAFFVDEVPFTTRARACDTIYQLLRRSLDPGTLPAGLPDDLYDARSLDMPEAALTEAVELLLEAAVPDGGLTCLVIRPTVYSEPEEWDLFLSHLSAQAAAAHVKYIVLDVDNEAPIPRLAPSEVVSAVLDFHFTPDEIREDATAAMSNPAAPLSERLRYQILVGSFAASSGDFPRALSLLGDAVQQAEDHKMQDLMPISWWTLGHSLQLQGALPEARNAYAEAAELAMAQNNDMALANALMKVGHTHFLQNQYEPAMRAYEAARRTWARIGYLFGECEALTWTGEAQAALGRFEEAEATFKDVLRRFEERRPPFTDVAREGRAETHERLARLYLRMNRPKQATSHRYQARSLGSQGLAPEKPA